MVEDSGNGAAESSDVPLKVTDGEEVSADTYVSAAFEPEPLEIAQDEDGDEEEEDHDSDDGKQGAAQFAESLGDSMGRLHSPHGTLLNMSMMVQSPIVRKIPCALLTDSEIMQVSMIRNQMIGMDRAKREAVVKRALAPSSPGNEHDVMHKYVLTECSVQRMAAEGGAIDIFERAFARFVEKGTDAKVEMRWLLSLLAPLLGVQLVVDSPPLAPQQVSESPVAAIVSEVPIVPAAAPAPEAAATEPAVVDVTPTTTVDHTSEEPLPIPPPIVDPVVQPHADATPEVEKPVAEPMAPKVEEASGDAAANEVSTAKEAERVESPPASPPVRALVGSFDHIPVMGIKSDQRMDVLTAEEREKLKQCREDLESVSAEELAVMKSQARKAARTKDGLQQAPFAIQVLAADIASAVRLRDPKTNVDNLVARVVKSNRQQPLSMRIFVYELKKASMQLANATPTAHTAARTKERGDTKVSGGKSDDGKKEKLRRTRTFMGVGLDEMESDCSFEVLVPELIGAGGVVDWTLVGHAEVMGALEKMRRIIEKMAKQLRMERKISRGAKKGVRGVHTPSPRWGGGASGGVGRSGPLSGGTSPWSGSAVFSQHMPSPKQEGLSLAGIMTAGSSASSIADPTSSGMNAQGLDSWSMQQMQQQMQHMQQMQQMQMQMQQHMQQQPGQPQQMQAMNMAHAQIPGQQQVQQHPGGPIQPNAPMHPHHAMQPHQHGQPNRAMQPGAMNGGMTGGLGAMPQIAHMMGTSGNMAQVSSVHGAVPQGPPANVGGTANMSSGSRLGGVAAMAGMAGMAAMAGMGGTGTSPLGSVTVPRDVEGQMQMQMRMPRPGWRRRRIGWDARHARGEQWHGRSNVKLPMQQCGILTSPERTTNGFCCGSLFLIRLPLFFL